MGDQPPKMKAPPVDSDDEEQNNKNK